jgi:hypothetical protein
VLGTGEDDDNEIEASRTNNEKFDVVNNVVNSPAFWTSMKEYVDLNASRVRSTEVVGSNDDLFSDACIELMRIDTEMCAITSAMYPNLLEDEAHVALLQAEWESRYQRH